MQPNLKLVTIDQLLRHSSLAENVQFDAKAGAVPTNLASVAEGYHLYVDISLTLTIAAAEDDASALTYLRIIEEFAAIADQAATTCNAKLLEIQGERIHFLVEATKDDGDGMRRLLTLAYVMVSVAYERLAPLAGEHWRGCRAAADHGKAAILISDTGGGSVVSLGVAANRPAKRLGLREGVRAGHLAMPEAVTLSVFDASTDRGWKQLNLLQPSEVLKRHVETEKRASVGAFTFDAVARKKVEFGGQTFFDSIAKNVRISPVKVQGFCLRADLDGFSRQVEDAFASGTPAVIALIERFKRILSLPGEYEKQVRARVLVLPWAGDCTTIVLLPQQGETFASARSSMPAASALTWHKLLAHERWLLESMGAAKWAVGLAGGDADDGNEGRMLVTELRAQGRTFRVVAGWAARRSNDGYQLEGIRGGDTTLTEQDHRGLASLWQKAFGRIPEVTTFLKAPLGALADAQKTALENATKPKPVHSPVGVTIPSARPHFS